MKKLVFTALALALATFNSALEAALPPSYFESEENMLDTTDRIDNRPVIAMWYRDQEKWGAWWEYPQTNERFEVTPELTARWNKKVRSEILAKIDNARAAALLKRLEVVSKRLAGMASRRLPEATGFKQIDFEFLALLRDPRDRPLFERLLDKNELDAKLFAGLVPDLQSARKAPSGIAWGPFLYTDPDVRAADHFLAVFDRKAVKASAPFRGRDGLDFSLAGSAIDWEKRHYLGEVEGSIKFATPLKSPFGTFRIYLCAVTNSGWETHKRTLALVRDQLNVQELALTNNAAFYFSTVLPGHYFAKVIWDRRPPFDNVASGGPGDYESDFVGPFDITAGNIITNIVLHCVKEGRMVGKAASKTPVQPAQRTLSGVEVNGVPFEFVMPREAVGAVVE